MLLGHNPPLAGVRRGLIRGCGVRGRDQLLVHGLVSPRFVPFRPLRELSDLVCHRAAEITGPTREVERLKGRCRAQGSSASKGTPSRRTREETHCQRDLGGHGSGCAMALSNDRR